MAVIFPELTRLPTRRRLGLVRWLVLLDRALSTRRVTQLVGLPPPLTRGIDQQRALPVAEALLVQGDDVSGISIERLTREGEFCGDTWHADLAEAWEQARFEFGEEALQDCLEIPDGVDALIYLKSEGQ